MSAAKLQISGEGNGWDGNGEQQSQNHAGDDVQERLESDRAEKDVGRDFRELRRVFVPQGRLRSNGRPLSERKLRYRLSESPHA